MRVLRNCASKNLSKKVKLSFLSVKLLTVIVKKQNTVDIVSVTWKVIQLMP